MEVILYHNIDHYIGLAMYTTEQSLVFTNAEITQMCEERRWGIYEAMHDAGRDDISIDDIHVRFDPNTGNFHATCNAKKATKPTI